MSEKRHEPKRWLTLTAYAELYDVDPRTVKKWADAGLVKLGRVTLRGQRRALVRIENKPPWDDIQ